jgi:hypothetical protein
MFLSRPTSNDSTSSSSSTMVADSHTMAAAPAMSSFSSSSVAPASLPPLSLTDLLNQVNGQSDKFKNLLQTQFDNLRSQERELVNEHRKKMEELAMEKKKILSEMKRWDNIILAAKPVVIDVENEDEEVEEDVAAPAMSVERKKRSREDEETEEEESPVKKQRVVMKNTLRSKLIQVFNMLPMNKVHTTKQIQQMYQTTFENQKKWDQFRQPLLIAMLKQKGYMKSNDEGSCNAGYIRLKSIPEDFDPLM